MRRPDPLLQRRRIWPGFEHLRVMVELQHQPVTPAQPPADQTRADAGVGADAETGAAVVDHETDRVGCVMRNSE